MMKLIDVARCYVQSGFSVVPILTDGSKKPSIAWKDYQSRLPTDHELVRWFGGKPQGIAIICGGVSGNLEVMDFDDGLIWQQWAGLVELELPGLLATLPQVRTPGGGMHLYYRLYDQPQGNHKLARGPDGAVLIETRGEGGYVLCPGCPPSCHPSGGIYRRIAGPELLQTPLLERPL